MKRPVFVIADDIAQLLAEPSGDNQREAVVMTEPSVPGTTGRWAFDPEETAADNGSTVREPNDGGPGRWFKIQ